MKFLLVSSYTIASEDQPRVCETKMEGYRPIRRLFNIIRIQPVENFRYPIDCQTCNWYISCLIMLIYNVQWYRSAFRCRWMEYNRQMVDAASWRSLVTELPMGCLYIAAGSEMPPPQNELFAIASEDRGFLSTIDVGSLTLCWKFVWQLREFFFFTNFFIVSSRLQARCRQGWSYHFFRAEKDRPRSFHQWLRFIKSIWLCELS